MTPLAQRFESTFVRTFSRSRNASFLQKLALCLAQGKWAKLLSLMTSALKMLHSRYPASAAVASATAAAPPPPLPSDVEAAAAAKPPKKQRGAVGESCAVVEAAPAPAPAPASASAGAAPATGGGGAEAERDGLSEALALEWHELSVQVARLRRQLANPQDGGGIAFAFVEGSLVRALREGHWMLLDELNLAAPETLERIATVLEENGSVALTERGDAHAVTRHPEFRIFGAMNPPTDFGKKDLPPGIRHRFTELYVEPISSSQDIQLVVLQQLSHVLPHPPVARIVAFYTAACAEADSTLLDGANQRPQYSLRSLCRALSYAADALPSYGVERALWDGFHMTFVTQLQQRFQTLVEGMLLKHLLPTKQGHPALKPPPASAPAKPSSGEWVQFGGFWVSRDPRHAVRTDDKYIVTPTVDMRMRQLARMTAARRFPVLLQGPTSAGKTSMVERLAHATGHRMVRINNHEHTDVQEYIGSFQPDATGQLHFSDGALAQAVRHGYWIVLDELNLAPSEVQLAEGPRTVWE